MKTILIPLDRYNALVKRLTTTGATGATGSGDNAGEGSIVERLAERLILLSIPKTFRGKATALLAHLEEFLKWNARGELVVDGQVVLTSNITDLLKDLYRREYAGPPPSGADVFWRVLMNANAPLSLILNEDRKQRLQQMLTEPQENDPLRQSVAQREPAMNSTTSQPSEPQQTSPARLAPTPQPHQPQPLAERPRNRDLSQPWQRSHPPPPQRSTGYGRIRTPPKWRPY